MLTICYFTYTILQNELTPKKDSVELITNSKTIFCLQFLWANIPQMQPKHELSSFCNTLYGAYFVNVHKDAQTDGQKGIYYNHN